MKRGTRLLALMGSELKIESVYGFGSTFSFEIKQEIADPVPIGDNIERRSEASGRRVRKNPQFVDKYSIKSHSERIAAA